MNWRESWMCGDVWSISRILQTVLFIRQAKAILLELGSVLPCDALCLPLFYAHAFGPQTALQPLEVGKQTRAISTLQWLLIFAALGILAVASSGSLFFGDSYAVMPAWFGDLLGLPYRREVGCGHSADEWIASWDCGGWHGWSLSYCVPLQP